MFLVRAAKDVMEKRLCDGLPAETRLDAFLRQPEHRDGMRHVVITHGDRIVGVVRINTGLRSKLAEIEPAITFGDVAQRDFTIVRETMSPST